MPSVLCIDEDDLVRQQDPVCDPATAADVNHDDDNSSAPGGGGDDSMVFESLPLTVDLLVGWKFAKTTNISGFLVCFLCSSSCCHINTTTTQQHRQRPVRRR